jgi:hypothetical protein
VRDLVTDALPGLSVAHTAIPRLQQQPSPGEITVTPADVCDAIVFCNAIAWGKVGAVVAALALTYGVAMSVARD